MISRFDPDKAEVALKQIFDPTVASKLRFDTAQTKFDEMLNAIEPKLTRAAARDLMDAIRSFRGKPHKIANDSELTRMVKQLR